MEVQYNINNLDDLKVWVEQFKEKLLQERLHHSQQLILLSGPMGAGKTQWVRYLVSSLSSQPDNNEGVSSPSFSIHNRYPVDFGFVDHIDLYRLEDEEDLESTGFWDLFAMPEACIIIEWADRLDRKFFPQGWLIYEIHFNVQGEKRLLSARMPGVTNT